MDIYADLLKLSEKLGEILRKQHKTLAIAESCTGGLISSLITEIPGSSDYFDRGIVTYSNKAKEELLGVSSNIIITFGAVSRECAEAMVLGLKKISRCNVCVSVTGIAGPEGGSVDKPVGLVYSGFCIEDFCYVEKNIFKGNRQAIRVETAKHVLEYLIKKLF